MKTLKTETERLILTIPEVAKALGISRGLAYELAKRDVLPIKIIHIGKRRMVVSRKALEDFLASASKPKEE